MIDKLLGSMSLNILERGLDASSARQKVIANNLSNVSTPGFKASEVSFEEELQLALAGDTGISGTRTNARHIPIGEPQLMDVKPIIRNIDGTELRNDANNVDIDREMAMLAKNTVMYNALAQKVSSEFSKLRYVISEGRR